MPPIAHNNRCATVKIKKIRTPGKIAVIVLKLVLPLMI